jgi:hypothetical protein
MTTALLTGLARRELAKRVGDGLEVTLYWDPDDNSTTVEVYHRATEETIAFPVAPDRALDAFHHPFAHLDYELERDLELWATATYPWRSPR